MSYEIETDQGLTTTEMRKVIGDYREKLYREVDRESTIWVALAENTYLLDIIGSRYDSDDPSYDTFAEETLEYLSKLIADKLNQVEERFDSNIYTKYDEFDTTDNRDNTCREDIALFGDSAKAEEDYRDYYESIDEDTDKSDE